MHMLYLCTYICAFQFHAHDTCVGLHMLMNVLHPSVPMNTYCSVRMLTHTYRSVHMYTHTYSSVHMYTHTYSSVHMLTHTYSKVCTLLCCDWTVSAQLHTEACAGIQMYSTLVPLKAPLMCARTHTSAHMGHVYMYTHLHMHCALH